MDYLSYHYNCNHIQLHPTRWGAFIPVYKFRYLQEFPVHQQLRIKIFLWYFMGHNNIGKNIGNNHEELYTGKEVVFGSCEHKTRHIWNCSSSPRLHFGFPIWNNNIQKTDNLNIHIPEFLSKNMHSLLYPGKKPNFFSMLANVLQIHIQYQIALFNNYIKDLIITLNLTLSLKKPFQIIWQAVFNICPVDVWQWHSAGDTCLLLYIHFKIYIVGLIKRTKLTAKGTPLEDISFDS